MSKKKVRPSTLKLVAALNYAKNDKYEYTINVFSSIIIISLLKFYTDDMMLKLVSFLAPGNIKLPRDAKEHNLFAFLSTWLMVSLLYSYILHLGSTGDLIFAFP